jgi:hypothetical protein
MKEDSREICTAYMEKKGKPQVGQRTGVTLFVFDGSKKSTSKGNCTRNEVFYRGYIQRRRVIYAVSPIQVPHLPKDG